MKKICIVGAGLFGTTLSLILSKNKNFEIDVFEKNNDILCETSLKNQQRFHLGYHYPRSEITVKEIKKSSNEFIKFYGKNIFGKTNNIYGISDFGSKLTYDKYSKIIKKFKLKLKKINISLFSKLVKNSIITEEKNLDYFKIKKKIISQIKKSNNINLKLNQSISKEIVKKYDKVILCAYSNNNNLLYKLGYKKNKLKKKRYELVEKIIVKLPKKFKNLSVVILDGNFLNFDPFIGTNYHLLSVVKESKIEVIKNKFPKFQNYKKKYLKYKFIRNKKISHFKKFITFGKKFVPLLSEAKYIKSTYVTRCIDISKSNQNRKTLVKLYGNKVITVFSGKWNNCVTISNQIKKLL